MFKKKQDTRRTSAYRQSAPVYSYHSSRSGAETARGRYDEPAGRSGDSSGRLRHLPTMLAVIIIIMSLLYTSVLNTNPRVLVAASSSGKSLQRPTAVYQQYIQNRLQDSIWNKNKLTLNAQPIVADLQKQFPEVATAIVTVPFLGHRPVVRIAVSSPAFVLATQRGSYYVSSTGVPLVRVSDVQHQLANLPTVTDETGLPISVGTQILPTDTVAFISTILQQFNATQTPIESVVLPLSANELHVRIKNQPYVVRFNTAGHAETQAGTFLAVKKRLEGSGDVPKEYIDVRVDERAYYK